MASSLLSTYLNDHLATASAGVALAKRSLGSNAGTKLGDFLRRLVVELEDDREALEDVMRGVDAGQDRVKVVAALAAERVGRLKPNGRLRGYSPLSRLVELEALVLIAESRHACWSTLGELAPSDPRLPRERLEELASRAERQRDELHAQRRLAAGDALTE